MACSKRLHRQFLVAPVPGYFPHMLSKVLVQVVGRGVRLIPLLLRLLQPLAELPQLSAELRVLDFLLEEPDEKNPAEPLPPFG